MLQVAGFLLLKLSDSEQRNKDDYNRRCRDERLAKGEIDVRIDCGVHRSSPVGQQALAIFGEASPLLTVVRTETGTEFMHKSTRFSTTEAFASINEKSSTGIRITWAVTAVTESAITFNCNTDVNRPAGQDTTATFTMRPTSFSSRAR